MTSLPRPTLINRAIAMTMAAAATIVIVAGSAAPAVAATLDGAPTATIDLAGIDLASPAGEARISGAVARAARRICTDGSERSVAAAQARRACIAVALDSALPQVAARADAARASRSALAAASPSTTTVVR